MKRFFVAVCLTLCLVAAGRAEKRDPQTFYLENGIKVKPLGFPIPVEAHNKGVSAGEFEVELPDAESTLEFALAESAGLAKEFQDDPQGPMKELYSLVFSAEKESKARQSLIITFAPLRDGKIDGSLFSTPEWKIGISYNGKTTTQVINNPALGYGSSQIYMRPAPDSKGLRDGSVPRQRSDAVGLMRFFKPKMPDDKMVTYKDIFLKFTIKPLKKP